VVKVWITEAITCDLWLLDPIIALDGSEFIKSRVLHTLLQIELIFRLVRRYCVPADLSQYVQKWTLSVSDSLPEVPDHWALVLYPFNLVFVFRPKLARTASLQATDLNKENTQEWMLL
jgi:hypothetical protein